MMWRKHFYCSEHCLKKEMEHWRHMLFSGCADCMLLLHEQPVRSSVSFCLDEATVSNNDPADDLCYRLKVVGALLSFLFCEIVKVRCVGTNYFFRSQNPASS